MNTVYNSSFFNEFYEKNGGGNYTDKERWMPFFSNIAEEIIRRYNPKTVLDAGCAMGYIVEALRDRGVEAYGFDISEYAINAVREDIKSYCIVHSITEPLPETFPQKYDLVITIEVLEHLFPEDAEKAVNNLCMYTDTIIFSSTPDDITDRTHVNVQQPEYWAKIFCKNMFFTELSSDMGFVSPWAKLYARKQDISKVIFDYEMNMRIDAMVNALDEKKEVIKIYFDKGDGFSEDNSFETPELNLENIDYEFEVPGKVRAIRIDPVENFFCIVKNLKVTSEKGDMALTTNGFNVENYILFDTNDPQIYFEVNNDSVTRLKITANVYILRNIDIANMIYEVVNRIKSSIKSKEKIEAENEELKQTIIETEQKTLEALRDIEELEQKNQLEKEKTEQELKHYQEHYHAASAQREELKNQVAQLQAMYDSISNSTCWKITKPIRMILDVIKSVLKKNRFTHLFWKGLKCLKQNGIKYTIQKIKMRYATRTATEYSQSDLKEMKNLKEKKSVSNDIKFSIIVPLYNTNEKYLREMIQSVIAQTYQNWELCLADGSDENHSYVERIVQEFQSQEQRIKYHRLDKNKGISENSNTCVKMASGDYIALLDHDDLLAFDALLANAWAIEETAADILYSDEDHLSMDGTYINPFYKPDWSPDLLYSQMYICHFLVIKKSLFDEIGGFRAAFDGSQDYDLMLRLSEHTDRICHIPLVLYHWRECEGSTAANADAKPYAHIAGKNALDEHLKRKYGARAFAVDGENTFTYNVRFLLQESPLVSIIIPMKDKYDLTDACIKSILEKTTYQNYEIILLDNRSEQPETFEWFQKIQQLDTRIYVYSADMDFNWSALNNLGISKAKGEVFVFLNNDTLVITADWLDRLVENALRDDIGVVGAMLLYEDNTIQHAGVVVGIGGWADHIFKGMMPVHYGSPFVSSVLSRNVLAVTGACMAISRKTVEQIGGFDESFIICGSDVEICVRAYESGLFNRYDANVRLYHLESKSRDSYIPEVDFQRSYECYTPYRENVDPFFNINLDNTAVVPKGRIISMDLINFKNFIKRCPLTASLYRRVKESIVVTQNFDIPEIGPVNARIDEFFNSQYRLNLLVPSVDEKHVFGGISTAMKFFENLRKYCGCSARIITLDAQIDLKTSTASQEYCLVSSDDNSAEYLQLVAFSDRHQKTIPVGKKDIFMATGWWTAYVIKDVIEWQRDTYGGELNPIIYFIQDYEPGFYPWSSRYLLADSTYRMDVPTLAVVNSHLLKDYFALNNYSFTNEWYFSPVLNDSLKKILLSSPEVVKKKKQIIVYGRPSVERNAFSLLIAALKVWTEKQENVHEWTIYSAGEIHSDIDLGNGIYLKAVGKLSLEEYAKMMLDTYAGISLMVSPHPSYPPLEMATFGVRVITNHYANKDLSTFNDNIISLASASPANIAQNLCTVCSQFNGEGILQKCGRYVEECEPFANIIDELGSELMSRVNI